MKKFISGIIFILLLVGLSACSKNQENENDGQDVAYKIYYLNNGETKMVSEPYTPKSSDVEGLIGELIVALEKKPSNLTYKKAKPDKVKIKEHTTNEDGQLTLEFESNYGVLSGVSEILCRASIVKTLCQIDGVESIEFYIDGQPLMNDNERPIGFMTENDFIDNGNEEGNNNQNAVMTLFFANKDGTQLVESRIKAKYDGTIPMEQLIIEQLMEGPDNIEGVEEDTLFATVPEGTLLQNSSIKDGVCYVDFNEKFLDRLSGVSSQVALYSVVNSLVEMSNVNKVQFTINGETRKTYAENIDFDIQFERNFELIAK